MPTPESAPHARRPHNPSPVPSDVSMRDLLASCVAAAALSTPPREPSAVAVAEARERRDAA